MVWSRQEIVFYLMSPIISMNGCSHAYIFNTWMRLS